MSNQEGDAAARVVKLARHLHAEGWKVHQLAHLVAVANLQCGSPWPVVDDVIRLLPGLSEWCSVADWEARYKGVMDDHLGL
jgi:hypothetical protein